jgi:hypothetical protein
LDGPHARAIVAGAEPGGGVADESSKAGEEVLYPVALLRIALELKRSPTPSLDELIRAVSARMKLDEPRLRAFLGENLVELEPATAPARPRRTPRG